MPETECNWINVYFKLRKTFQLSNFKTRLDGEVCSSDFNMQKGNSERAGRCLWLAYRCITFADCRPQISDFKLKDTKNLPNKGDTIKNITSCESEKVAWEQGWCFCAKLHWPHSQDAVGYSSPARLFIDSPGISVIALILYSSLIIVNWWWQVAMLINACLNSNLL